MLAGCAPSAPPIGADAVGASISLGSSDRDVLQSSPKAVLVDATGTWSSAVCLEDSPSSSHKLSYLACGYQLVGNDAQIDHRGVLTALDIESQDGEQPPGAAMLRSIACLVCSANDDTLMCTTCRQSRRRLSCYVRSTRSCSQAASFLGREHKPAPV